MELFFHWPVLHCADGPGCLRSLAKNRTSEGEIVAKNLIPKGARTRTGGTNDHNSYLRGAVRVRAQRTATQGGDRVNDWHCDRVVRLLPLRHGGRAHFRQAVLSQFGS